MRVEETEIVHRVQQRRCQHHGEVPHDRSALHAHKHFDWHVQLPFRTAHPHFRDSVTVSHVNTKILVAITTMSLAQPMIRPCCPSPHPKLTRPVVSNRLHPPHSFPSLQLLTQIPFPDPPFRDISIPLPTNPHPKPKPTKTPTPIHFPTQTSQLFLLPLPLLPPPRSFTFIVRFVFPD